MQQHVPLTSSTPILSVENLTTSFFVEGKWRPVVRDISFSVSAGETLAVVGESGSGKSVTSLSIMRLLDKDTSRIEGRVMLEGKNLLALNEAAMRQVRGNDIAMIFQEPMTSLNPLFTIGDQICEALMCHTTLTRLEAKTQALKLLDRVRIPSAASRFDEYPHSLSGGMRQRIMIAMALATKPKLLIADEPTTALDVTIQGQILDLIKELQQEEGMAVLFITHDMGVVAEIADRGVVMLRGEAVEVGQTADLFARANHPYSRALLAAVPILGSMKPYDRPLKFPDLDEVTGLPGEAVVSENTVDTQAAPILEVKNLVKRFSIHAGLMGRLQGRVHAIENVNFSLQPGETLSLVGESGCGKSTTARACMRLIEPDSGSVKLEGEEMIGLDTKSLRARRHKMQMIFQDPFASLNPRIRIGDAIAEPYLEHGLGSKTQAREKVALLLQQVGLGSDMASRFPHEFSGGQRQRICIARALALNPKLIVADESVSALDVSIKAQIINLMLVPVPDASTRVEAAISGQYDYVDSIPVESYDRVSSAQAVEPFILEPFGWPVFVMNTSQGIAQSQELRQAVQVALNEADMLAAAFGSENFYKAEGALYPENFVWHTPIAVDGRYNVGDAERAKELLKQANYDGSPLRILTSRQYEFHYKMAQVAAEYLKLAGFTVDMQVVDWATLTQRRADPALWDIYITHSPFLPEPSLIGIMSTSAPGRWDTPARAAALDAFNAEADMSKRVELWAQVQKVWMEEVPAIKIGNFNAVAAKAKSLSGVEPAPWPYFWNVWQEK